MEDIMEWIKSIIEKHTGEDGKLNLTDAIKEINKQAPENVVPKEQYNTVAAEKKQLEADVHVRDTQLEDLKKAGSVEDLTDQLATAQEANKTAKAEYDQKIKDMKYDAAIEKSLANAVHPDLVSGKVDRSKLKLNEDGTVTGLDEQVKNLKETYKDMFKPDKKGKTPPNPEGGNPLAVTKEEFDKMGYLSKVKLKNENPELYTSLKAEGGNE